MARFEHDLVIVGMGSAGLSAARVAKRLGLRVLAVERDRFGGDCLWSGCVPSKTLLAEAARGSDLGIVWKRIRHVQDDIVATDDDPVLYRRLGVEVRFGTARLADEHVVEVAGERHSTRFALICTGSRPAVPAIPGLREAGFLTNERLFAEETVPERLVVIGGGPVGVELSQALTRFGVEVTLLQRNSRLLPRDESRLTETLTGVLIRDGVQVETGVVVERVERRSLSEVAVHGSDVCGGERIWTGGEVLVATGREPVVDGLDLDSAGVRTEPGGIPVDTRLRTTQGWVYAVGDVTTRPRFTHTAGYDAVTAVRNMFLPGSSPAPAVVPWCTFTDPELAHVGATGDAARRRWGAEHVEVWESPLTMNDRARTEDTTDGAVILVTAKGRLVGAHMLAPAAGEGIHELALAIRERMRLRALAGLVHVYPTTASTVGLLAAETALSRAGKLKWLARAWRWRSR